MSKPLIHDPGNLQPIQKLWAWLSVDENGNEGICAVTSVNDRGETVHIALVTADPKLLAICQAMADDIKKHTNKRIICAEFERRKTE